MVKRVSQYYPEVLLKYNFDDPEFLTLKSLYYPQEVLKNLSPLLDKLKRGIIDDEAYYSFIALLILKEVHHIQTPEFPEPWKSIYELHKRIKAK